MTRQPTEAFFVSLAGIKGQVDARRMKNYPCDLSGKFKGFPTGADVLDQLEADAECVIPEESREKVLKSYVDSYNRVARHECAG